MCVQHFHHAFDVHRLVLKTYSELLPVAVLLLFSVRSFLFLDIFVLSISFALALLAIFFLLCYFLFYDCCY